MIKQKSVPWSYVDALFLIAAIGAITVLLTFLWIYAGWDDFTLPRVLVSYILQIVLEVLALWWFIFRKYRVSRSVLSWSWYSFGQMFGWVMQGQVLIILVAIILVTLSAISPIALPGFEQQMSYTELFGVGTLNTIALAVVGIIIAPITEEVLFRGVVLRAFARNHAWIGIIVSSAAFAGMHFQFQTFFPLFGIGIVLGYMFLKTKSLPLAILLHASNNGLALLVQLYASHSELPIGLFGL